MKSIWIFKALHCSICGRLTESTLEAAWEGCSNRTAVCWKTLQNTDWLYICFGNSPWLKAEVLYDEGAVSSCLNQSCTRSQGVQQEVCGVTDLYLVWQLQTELNICICACGSEESNIYSSTELLRYFTWLFQCLPLYTPVTLQFRGRWNFCSATFRCRVTSIFQILSHLHKQCMIKTALQIGNA